MGGQQRAPAVHGSKADRQAKGRHSYDDQEMRDNF
jgi:hypothetical protein